MQFSKANAGKISLIAVLFLAVVGVMLLRGSGQPSRAGKIRLVCVATGETVWIDRGQTLILPLENEKTGQRTLLPCYEGEGGKLYLTQSCRGELARLDKQNLNQCVDLETLLVRGSP